MRPNILLNLIDNFDNAKFQLLAEEMNDSFRYSNQFINEYDDDDFDQSCCLGELSLQQHERVIFYSFRVKKPLTEKSGKKAQYEKGKKVLKDLIQYDAGIFAFYDDQGSFRLSLISISYFGTKKKFSSFKRSTFFVSKDQTNKTFRNQILNGNYDSIEHIKEVFSVEKVTREFYNEIFYWYLYACQICKWPDDTGKNDEKRNTSVIRMVTRLIFIWFMREKGLINRELFDERAVKNILVSVEDESNSYYLAILQNLFFATLNTPQDKRRFRKENKENQWRNEDFGNTSVCRYHDLFVESNKIPEYFENIPFLNGGLFECLDKGKENIYIDGFTERTKYQPSVPNKLFFADELKPDLNKEMGTNNSRFATKGIFNIFSEYNFTIDENTADDKEIALDPELLGQVFENLLAYFNPETKETARKETGSFYTPREIVEYMVDESLLLYFRNYLESHGVNVSHRSRSVVPTQPGMFGPNQNSLPITESLEECLENLISYDTEPQTFSEEETNLLIQAIKDLRVLDPACGSGAFPMGILHKLVHVLGKLDPENYLWKTILIEEAVQKTKEAYQLEDNTIRKDRIQQIENDFDFHSEDYGRKLYLIEKCIYGADIQPIAIQITKLRFFISLLVDQTIDKKQPNWGVKALPNLEMKFVAANSLLSLSKDLHLKDPELILQEEKLDDLRHKLFSGLPAEEKERIKQSDKETRKKMGEILTRSGFDNEDAKLLSEWDPFNQNESANFFDPPSMMGINHGFDIVIGNPPYIQLSKIKRANSEVYKLYRNAGFEVHQATGDVYCLFIEQGYNLLKDNAGVFCMITSNKWMRAEYGESLRDFLANNTTPVYIIDFTKIKVFEAATVDVAILIFENILSNSETLSCKILDKWAKEDLHSYIKSMSIKNVFSPNKLWLILTDIEKDILKKVEALGTPLKDWDITINRGILTGLNEAFIIDGAKKDELIARDPKSAEIIRPILRGRDIKRYGYDFADLWLIATHNGITRTNTPLIDVNRYPAIKDHLKQFQPSLRKRFDQGATPYNLRDCTYMEDFYKQKIIYPCIMAQGPSFMFDEQGKFFTIAPGNIISGKSILYLLGFLCSKTIYYALRNFYMGGGIEGELKTNRLLILPVPYITTRANSIEELVLAMIRNNKPSLKAEISDEIELEVQKAFDLNEAEKKEILKFKY